MPKLPIKPAPNIAPAYVAKVEAGARAVHGDLTSLLAGAGKEVAVEKYGPGDRCGDYNGRVARVFENHARDPQRTLFHELAHAIDDELGLSNSPGFIAAYRADKERALENGTYQSKFLNHADADNEDAQRKEVTAYCTQWQSEAGEAPGFYHKAAPRKRYDIWQSDFVPADTTDKKLKPSHYQETYPQCWQWIAENAPSIDHGFAGLAERWGQPHARPLMPALRFITAHTGNGKWPGAVAPDAPAATQRRATILRALHKVERVVDEMIAPALRDPQVLVAGIKLAAAVIVPAVAIHAGGAKLLDYSLPANHMLLVALGAGGAIIGFSKTAPELGEQAHRARSDEKKRTVFAKAAPVPKTAL